MTTGSEPPADPKCFLLCPTKDVSPCPDCQTVHHCQDHKQFHKTGSSGSCGPFLVSSVEGAGRGLVATRDIAKGEVIFTSLPAAVGPCARTDLQCVDCFLLLTSPHFCSRCGLMVCSKHCSEGPNHQTECSILSLLRTKLKKKKKAGERSWKEALLSLPASVTTLRLLSLKWRDPPSWSLVTSLMDHQVNPAVWAIIKEAYDRVLHLDPRIQEADLRSTLGIQNTNGANLHFPPGYGRGVGVFPIQAFLNHSCMCNTVTQEFVGEHKLEVKARFLIKAGEEITTSYIPPTQATFCRRHGLHNTWKFWCACKRCRDPTEYGSNIGGMTCERPKCGGVVLCRAPLDNDSPWSCNECGLTMDSEQAIDRLQLAVEHINITKTGSPTPDQLEHLLTQLEHLLCPTHHIILELEQKLLNLYISLDRGQLTRPIRDRKVQLSSNILSYMDKIDPGNTDGKKSAVEQ